MNIIERLTRDKNLLLSELSFYGSVKAKEKNKHTCPFCSHRDALGVKLKNGKFYYKCFSCQKYGDVINLVIEREGLEGKTKKAIKLIADRNGIELPEIKLTKEDKIKYAKIKKEEEIKERNLKKIEEDKKEAIKNHDLDKAFYLECEEDRLKNTPIKILEFPSLNFKGEPLKTWDNLKALLDYKEIYVVYNEISKNIEIKGLESEDLDDCIMDIHLLCHTNGLNLNIDFIGKCVNRIGSSNLLNPVADYLSECYMNWDKKEGRIKQLCNTLVVSEDFSESLRDTLVTKWLLNTVKIPFNQGDFNTEGTLVLQGKQGLKKTTWINKITPTKLKDYTKTGLNLDPSDKDKVYQAVKYWLAELGELDSTMKAEQGKLKAFFTEKIDEFRRPYAKNTSKYPRKTSFFGTVNKREFLKDETGDRRYWVIPCIKILIDKVENIDINQLWGEVMHLEEKGVIHYLTDDEQDKLNQSNSGFRSSGKTQILIENSFDWEISKNLWIVRSSKEIAHYLSLNTTSGIDEALKAYGIDYKIHSLGKDEDGKRIRKRGYLVPPYKSDVIENVDW